MGMRNLFYEASKRTLNKSCRRTVTIYERLNQDSIARIEFRPQRYLDVFKRRPADWHKHMPIRCVKIPLIRRRGSSEQFESPLRLKYPIAMFDAPYLVALERDPARVITGLLNSLLKFFLADVPYLQWPVVRRVGIGGRYNRVSLVQLLWAEPRVVRKRRRASIYFAGFLHEFWGLMLGYFSPLCKLARDSKSNPSIRPAVYVPVGNRLSFAISPATDERGSREVELRVGQTLVLIVQAIQAREPYFSAAENMRQRLNACVVIERIWFFHRSIRSETPA